MAETLTYEEAPKEQFSEEELDSIKVGEEIEVQQDNLLAGKYKDAEELEKAYLELQTKLGEKSSEDKVEESEPQNQAEPETKEEEDKPDEGPNILDKLWDQREEGFVMGIVKMINFDASINDRVLNIIFPYMGWR